MRLFRSRASADTGVPITPGATPETVALYRYLRRLKGRSEIVIGWEDKYKNMPAQHATPTLHGTRGEFATMTGKYPGAMMMEYHDSAWANRYGQVGTDAQIQWIKDLYAAGTIIALHMHPGNPVTGQLSRNGHSVPILATTAGYWQDRSNDPLAAIKAGGAQNSQYVSFMSRLADFFESLVDSNGNPIPVIWRPWHECTTNAHWWAGIDRAGDFVLVWRQMVDYLRDTRGLTNVLYAINYDGAGGASDWSPWWPGADYVDIVSFDSYDNRDPAGAYIDIDSNGLFTAAYNRSRNFGVTYDKPIILAEYGYQQAQATQAALYTTRTFDILTTQYTHISAALGWGYSQQLSNSVKFNVTPSSSQIVQESLATACADPRVITLEKLSGPFG